MYFLEWQDEKVEVKVKARQIGPELIIMQLFSQKLGFKFERNLGKMTFYAVDAHVIREMDMRHQKLSLLNYNYLSFILWKHIICTRFLPWKSWIISIGNSQYLKSSYFSDGLKYNFIYVIEMFLNYDEIKILIIVLLSCL